MRIATCTCDCSHLYECWAGLWVGDHAMVDVTRDTTPCMCRYIYIYMYRHTCIHIPMCVYLSMEVSTYLSTYLSVPITGKATAAFREIPVQAAILRAPGDDMPAQ